MKKSIVALVLAPTFLALAGCDTNPFAPAVPPPTAAAPPAGTVTAAPQRIAPPAGSRSAAAFDRTSEAERAAARAAPATGQVLGQATVSLGNPADQGFWLRSALVTEKRPGVVKLPSGATVQVDLLPLAGGGPQLSLAAYRALGLGLTALPTVSVLSR